MQKMPILKQLSYLFARAAGEDVFCSRMVRETKSVPVRDECDNSVILYHMSKHYFRWAEARPVADEPGRYQVMTCHYGRNGAGAVSNDRWYRERAIVQMGVNGPHFSRVEADRLIRHQEQKWQRQGLSAVTDAPFVLRQLRVCQLSPTV